MGHLVGQATALDQDAEPELKTAPPRRHVGWWVVLALFILSTSMGVFVYVRYSESESYLAQEFERIRNAGAGLSVEGCIDEVLAFEGRCEAMEGLCAMSRTGMMMGCLSAGDRSEYCGTLGPEAETTDFGFRECQARGLSRSGRTACGETYRAIRDFCRARSDEAAGSL